jgi:hypothetical protein
LRAITVAFVFSRTIDLSMRMSSFVHGCRFVVFVAISAPHPPMSSRYFMLFEQLGERLFSRVFSRLHGLEKFRGLRALIERRDKSPTSRSSEACPCF